MAYSFKNQIRQLVNKKFATKTKLICLLWTFIYAILISCLGHNIYRIFIKWYIDPDVSTNIKTVSVHNIPFPSITYCTPNIIPDEVVNFTEFQLKLFLKIDLPAYCENDKNLLGSMIEICAPNFESGIKAIGNRQESNIVKLLNESINEDLMPNFCTFKNLDVDCNKMFNLVPTQAGLCYAFNMQGYNTILNEGSLTDDFQFYRRKKIVKSLNTSSKLYNKTVTDNMESIHWTLQEGYTSEKIDIIPYRLSKHSLVLYIKPEKLTYFKCIGNYFHISLSLPNEIPVITNGGVFVNVSSLTQITIVARSIKRNRNMYKYSPEIRKCFIDGEKKLKFFKTYTKAHCDFECFTNYTVKSCGCARFFMPRSSEIRVCNLQDIPCFIKAFKIMNVYKKQIDGHAVPCNCLPTCNRILYSAKKALSEPLSSSIHLVPNILNINISGFTIIQISTDASDIEEHEYFVAYGLQNFIADIGGLLGLFLGYSFLSIVQCMQKLFDYLQRIKINNGDSGIIQVLPRNNV